MLVTAPTHHPEAQPHLSADCGLPVVHLVDEDPRARAALCRLLRAAEGTRVECHAGLQAFLEAYDAEAPACVVADHGLRLQGRALQDHLQERGLPASVVFLAAGAGVPACADALRRGAVDFLAKPVDEELLLDAVARALARDAALRTRRDQQALIAGRLALLTPREREVLEHVTEGRLNKQIASDIGTTEKTVKVHRARAMEKMRVRSVAELVRLIERGRAEVAV
jgi:FixJ family two-component response regulator